MADDEDGNETISDQAPLLNTLDNGSIQPSASTASSRSYTLVLAAAGVLTAAFAISFDIAYCAANYSRQIASDLNELSRAALIPIAGSLTEAVVQPIYGYAAQSFGSGRPALVASIMLSIGLFVCFSSQTLWQLVCGRAIFGFGSSGIHLLAIIMLSETVTLSAVPLYRSVLVLVQNVAFMSGGPLGSLIAKASSWHLPFLLEFGVSCVAVASLSLTQLAKYQPPKGSKSTGQISAQAHRDLGGLILLVFTTLCFLLAITLGTNLLSFSNPFILSLLAATPLLAAALVYTETKVVQHPMLSLWVLTSQQTLTVIICTILTIVARNQYTVHISFYAEVRSELNATFKDWVLTCHFLGISLGAVFSGWIIAQRKRFKWLLVIVTMFATFFFVLMATGLVHPEDPRHSIILVLIGVSMAVIHNSLIIAFLSGINRKNSSMSYAVFEMSVSIAAELGVAVPSALQQKWFIDLMYQNFGHSRSTEKLISESLKSLAKVRGFPQTTRDVVLHSFQQSLCKTFGTSAVLFAMAVVMATLIQNRSCETWSGSEATAVINSDNDNYDDNAGDSSDRRRD